jgi:hypothetical protein
MRTLLLSALALVAGPAPQDPWILNDLPTAQAEARKTGKPIFAVFRCER